MILYGIDYQKTTFVGYRHVSLSLYDAVAVFHNWFKGNIDIYVTMTMRPVLFTRHFLQNKI